MSLAAVAAGVMVGGTVMSAVGQRKQTQEQAKWMKYDAAVAESQATAERQSAAYEAGQKRKEGQRIQARQLALFGKTGISPQVGSPLLTMMDTAIEVEKDARLIEIGGKQRGLYYEREAAMQRGMASATRKAGNWAFGTTLLTGLGSAGMAYATYKQASQNNKNWLHSKNTYKATNAWLEDPWH